LKSHVKITMSFCFANHHNTVTTIQTSQQDTETTWTNNMLCLLCYLEEKMKKNLYRAREINIELTREMLSEENNWFSHIRNIVISFLFFTFYFIFYVGLSVHIDHNIVIANQWNLRTQFLIFFSQKKILQIIVADDSL
jgi:hypothetical protein